MPYVNDLRHVVDMDAIRAAGSRSASTRWAARVGYWEPINACTDSTSTSSTR